jgi:hypothetical protein
MGDTPNYIKSLLIPNGKKPAGRRIWSIELEGVWLPFLTATNTMGDTAIPSDALGAPLRLAFDADGLVKFSKAGRPVTKVAKELSEAVRMVRDNFTAGLLSYANGVSTDNPEGYKAQLDMAREAGQPIIASDREKLDKAISQAVERQLAEAHKGKATKGRKAELVTA